MATRRLLLAATLLTLTPAASWAATPRWLTLPPTPTLPASAQSGYAPVNGIRIWYAVFGEGQPVIMLHGGLANANYWGNQVPELARHYKVIVMDSRGHGRSTRDARPYGYDLMADDVVALLDYLKIDKVAVVGWSDGAILDLALRHPARVSKVFSFAANTETDGVVEGVEKNPTFAAYIERAGHEYEALSATPKEYDAFVDQISKMWATQPHWTADQLKTINVPVVVVDGDHDEAIKRPHTEQIAAQIPGAGLLIQPNVSHFSFLQDPPQFTGDVLRFLQENP
jgi:pimeloyl-ACP methyl ester carboxylesterase